MAVYPESATTESPPFHFEIAADLLDQEEIELWARCVLDWSS